MSPRAAITPKTWEAHKGRVCYLYINENRTLDEVAYAMQARGARASKQQHERQFKKWGMSTNQRALEWKNINR